MSYLGFLDKPTLFEVLLRMHYEDLVNLCKAKSYLWKLYCTNHFSDEWKKYNIKVIENKEQGTEIEVDRLNIQHGKSIEYLPNGKVYQEKLYLAGQIIQGTRWPPPERGSYQKITVSYVDGIEHGAAMAEYKSATHEIIPYVNSKVTGLNVCRRHNGWIIWREYLNNFQHGKHYEWYPNGGLSSMSTYKDGAPHGKVIKWYQSGVKRSQYTVNSKDYKEWDQDGQVVLNGRP